MKFLIKDYDGAFLSDCSAVNLQIARSSEEGHWPYSE